MKIMRVQKPDHDSNHGVNKSTSKPHPRPICKEEMQAAKQVVRKKKTLTFPSFHSSKQLLLKQKCRRSASWFKKL